MKLKVRCHCISVYQDPIDTQYVVKDRCSSPADQEDGICELCRECHIGPTFSRTKQVQIMNEEVGVWVAV